MLGGGQRRSSRGLSSNAAAANKSDAAAGSASVKPSTATETRSRGLRREEQHQRKQQQQQQQQDEDGVPESEGETEDEKGEMEEDQDPQRDNHDNEDSLDKLSVYELERLRRLEENKKHLQALGILRDPVHEITKQPPPKQVRIKKLRVIIPRGPRRSSNRLAGKEEEFTGLKYKEINVDDDDKAILLSGDDDNKSNESDGEREYDTDGKPIIIKRGKPTQPKPASKRGKGAHRRYEIGGRIYDSVNGTSCHQCRQKTMDPKVTCTNLIVYRNADGSETRAPCPLMMDDQCLMGRYGEKVAEMAARGDWVCPKCRGICNCSFCMAKRGKQPTGQLKMQALQLGYKSVSDMLAKTGALVPKKRTRKEAKQEAKGNTVNAVEDIAAAAAELDDIAKKDAVDGNLEEVDGNTTENEESKCQDFSG